MILTVCHPFHRGTKDFKIETSTDLEPHQKQLHPTMSHIQHWIVTLAKIYVNIHFMILNKAVQDKPFISKHIQEELYLCIIFKNCFY